MSQSSLEWSYLIWMSVNGGGKRGIVELSKFNQKRSVNLILGKLVLAWEFIKDSIKSSKGSAMRHLPYKWSWHVDLSRYTASLQLSLDHPTSMENLADISESQVLLNEQKINKFNFSWDKLLFSHWKLNKQMGNWIH